jgi:hypothetical protein
MPQNNNHSLSNWILVKHFIGFFDDPERSIKYQTEMCHVKCRKCSIPLTIPYNTREKKVCICATMTTQEFEKHKKKMKKINIPYIKIVKKAS